MLPAILTRIGPVSVAFRSSCDVGGFGDAGLHYWLAPLIALGRIESPASPGSGTAEDEAPGA